MKRRERLRVPFALFGGNETLRLEAAAVFPDSRFHAGPAPLRGQALADFMVDAELTIIGGERLDEALLAACPKLRAVGKFGVGLDNLDLDACRRKGVHVGWTGGINADAVAELTLGLMLAAGRDIFRSALDLRAGRYRREPSRTLIGATVGIIGFGHIGRALVPLLAPFGCRILANDARDVASTASRLGVEVVTREELYAQSDFVTLHVPLAPDTVGMIDAAALARFKEGAILVNTARGGVADEAAVLDALRSGRLGGAALDVLAVEPPVDLALPQAERALVTPHIGSSSRASILTMGRSALQHLVHYVEGRPGTDAATLFASQETA